MTKYNHHDEVKKQISEAYRSWAQLRNRTKVISTKLSRSSFKKNKTLFTILKLVILGDSLIFLLIVIAAAFWHQHVNL